MNTCIASTLLAAGFRASSHPPTSHRQSLPVCMRSMFGWYEAGELAQHSVTSYFLRVRASGVWSCRPGTQPFGL